MIGRKKDNSIYYFLGNITSHISHVLPLYKELGGTVVVTSKRAFNAIKHYPVDIKIIENKPFRLMRPGWRPKLIHEYTVIDKQLEKTCHFLNRNAKIILFYELFEIKEPSLLKDTIKIFLHHGNGLKPFFKMQPKRIKMLKNYDYIASLGPNLKNQLLSAGVKRGKLLDIGTARTDSVAKIRGEVSFSNAIKNLPGITSDATIVSYIPTFWGNSSIYNTGISIVRNIPNRYTLLFKPHPQTPRKIINKYKKMINKKQNIHLIWSESEVSVPDILKASSVIIGDLSSVMMEAVLTYKPLIFAYDTGMYKHDESDYFPIKEIVDSSESITTTNSHEIAKVVSRSIDTKVNKSIWRKSIENNFYNSDGLSSKAIAKKIKSLM